MRKEKITIHQPEPDIEIEVDPVTTPPPLAPGPDGKPKKKRGRTSAYSIRRAQALAVHMLQRYAYGHEVLGILKNVAKIESPALRKKILAQARKAIPKIVNRPTNVWREKSIGFWLSIIRDKNADLGTRMAAQSKLDAILGLNAPLQIESKNVSLEIGADELRRRALQDPQATELMAQLAEKVAGFQFLPPPQDGEVNVADPKTNGTNCSVSKNGEH